LNTFGAGITSTLIPKGSKFFNYGLSRTSKNKNSDVLARWLNECSIIANDFINESNFFTEAPKSFEDLGLIGTSLMLVEPDTESGIRFKSYYIDSFAFTEDAKGRTDQVFFKINMTARQLKLQFPDAELPSTVEASANANSDDTFCVYLIIGPRLDGDNESLNPQDWKYFSKYILEQQHVLLKESGYRKMPAAVCRWKQASNETYGRSPAIEVQSTLGITNAMEYTKLKSAQRIADPQWLCPNDGSVRNLNNQSGGVVFYNAANPNAKPEQLPDRGQPNLTDNYIQQKIRVIEDAFFVSIFNPLLDKQNMTLGEVQQRMAIANQNLVPSISRVIDELLKPVFVAVFQILLDNGYFPDAPSEFTDRDLQVSFISRAAMAIQALEAQAALQYAEIIGQMAQFTPDALDRINIDEVAKLQAKSLSLPNEVVPSDNEVQQRRQERAQQEANARQLEANRQLAETYSKTADAPEDGSPAAALLRQRGI